MAAHYDGGYDIAMQLAGRLCIVAQKYSCMWLPHKYALISYCYCEINSGL